LHHIVAWSSDNSSTKSHEDRPRGSRGSPHPTGLNRKGVVKQANLAYRRISSRLAISSPDEFLVIARRLRRQRLAARAVASLFHEPVAQHSSIDPPGFCRCPCVAGVDPSVTGSAMAALPVAARWTSRRQVDLQFQDVVSGYTIKTCDMPEERLTTASDCVSKTL